MDSRQDDSRRVREVSGPIAFCCVVAAVAPLSDFRHFVVYVADRFVVPKRRNRRTESLLTDSSCMSSPHVYSLKQDAQSTDRKRSDSSGHADNKAVGNPATPKTYFSEEELDRRFADRYTERDPDYQEVVDRPSPAPPVITDW